MPPYLTTARRRIVSFGSSTARSRGHVRHVTKFQPKDWRDASGHDMVAARSSAT